jgi:hypothetical protein
MPPLLSNPYSRFTTFSVVGFWTLPSPHLDLTHSECHSGSSQVRQGHLADLPPPIPLSYNVGYHGVADHPTQLTPQQAVWGRVMRLSGKSSYRPPSHDPKWLRGADRCDMLNI